MGPLVIFYIGDVPEPLDTSWPDRAPAPTTRRVSLRGPAPPRRGRGRIDERRLEIAGGTSSQRRTGPRGRAGDDSQRQACPTRRARESTGKPAGKLAARRPRAKCKGASPTTQLGTKESAEPTAPRNGTRALRERTRAMTPSTKAHPVHPGMLSRAMDKGRPGCNSGRPVEDLCVSCRRNGRSLRKGKGGWHASLNTGRARSGMPDETAWVVSGSVDTERPMSCPTDSASFRLGFESTRINRPASRRHRHRFFPEPPAGR